MLKYKTTLFHISHPHHTLLGLNIENSILRTYSKKPVNVGYNAYYV